MRAGGDDLLDVVPLDGLYILGGQGLVEILVAHLPHGLAAAFLLLPQDPDLDACSPAELNKAGGDGNIALIKGGIAADEVEDIHLRVLGDCLEAQFLGPVAPGGIAYPQGIAVDLGLLHGGHDLVARELPFHQHQVAAHLDDLVHVFNGGRADVLASPAGGAGPEGVAAYGLDQVGRGIGEGDLADLAHHLHGRQRFVGGPGRASVLAAFALGAGVGIEDILPGQIGKLGCPEALRLLVFHIHGYKFAHRAPVGQKVIGAGGEDMPELGEGDGDDKEHDQQQMEPPGPGVQRPQAVFTQACHGLGKDQAHR